VGRSYSSCGSELPQVWWEGAIPAVVRAIAAVAQLRVKCYAVGAAPSPNFSLQDTAASNIAVKLHNFSKS
jgi:hypothetical protein